ncbi:glutamate 5-kinase [Arcticibacterium luteifluviistationis]|uniref:Glutamate 5-kinase n=1 Tax=Arcticibacterium luteifluviistationis TaxID=1784714 RepID=A0A2Z4GCG8_9BACT|nr:glutamate 5-kinase [Arcticibacterium luteifluviistationis]AWV98926.1 glutamate 5-kinase [Arcticibacterium luteifluviistationis]
MTKPILVIKFGTSAISNKNGEPDENIIGQIAQEVSQLQKTHHIVLVSSGAVGAGKKFIYKYDGSLSKRKAAAAIGNPRLIIKYNEAFEKHGIQVAQSLCERRHFANRELFLELKETYQELWENDIIPIANENDVVSDRELKFSDNDELATLIAAGFGASHLMIATESGGLLDNNKEVVSHVAKIDESIMNLVDTSKSSLGTGGMSSKLTFAKLANKMGIKVTVFGIKEGQGGILKSFEEKEGTTFEPEPINLSARNKWLISGGLTTARLVLDQGAVKAIKKRKSLLAVGISSISGAFGKGEVVELTNEKEEVIAIARCREASVALKNRPQNLIVAHADDIVLV